MDRTTLLTYTDFNENFKIYTNTNDLKLGAVIFRKGKPIAFYSRKRTESQKRYTVTERELLSIIETMKSFRTILLGQKLRICTDHTFLLARALILIEY